MDKTIAGLVAVGAMAVAGGAQAAVPSRSDVTHALAASSYADLLKPVPNALALWKASAEMPAAGETSLAQNHDHHAQQPYRDERSNEHHHHAARVVVPRTEHHHHAAAVVVPRNEHHHHHDNTVVVPR